MRKLLKCRVAIVIAAGWLVLSIVGYLGKDSIYKNYSIDVAKTPYFVLVLQGIHDHIYPWDPGLLASFQKPQDQIPETVLAQTLQEESETTETIATTEEKEAEESETAETITTEEEKETEESETTEVPKNQEKKETVVKKKRFVEVGMDYFSDALFIGDSRTVGLHDYGGIEGADFFATVGMSVYDLWTDRFCEVDGEDVTLEEALSAKQYKKIYFQLGINEMGRGTIDEFMEQYAWSVEKIKQLQPDAMIYVQGIMKVAKAKSDSDAIFNNEGIQARNERIVNLADGDRVFYIDVNEVVCDEDGALKKELTFDNLHLYGSEYGIWVDFLKSKGIEEVEEAE